MNFKTKVAIFLLALFVTFVAVEAIVQGTDADEILKLARRAGDNRLFTIVAQTPVHNDLGHL